MIQAHGFDLQGCFARLHNEVYCCIKAVNYVRARSEANACIRCEFTGQTRGELLGHLTEQGHLSLEAGDAFLEGDEYLTTLEKDSGTLSWMIGSLLAAGKEPEDSSP
eukprot:TRINITY_DN41638_c0_g1_i1.p1 TRINITY_DN41638_c0_g1~~TRINITY_DN41638_c0_g1_i1.p1  ORF type:complete len:107 (-),score=18.69 TRINITY_DN41638_c0_g1_i1:281-601(-)